MTRFLRPQVSTALAFAVLAGVAMFDTRRGALFDASGRAPGGIGGGFYPFWAAAVLGAGALILLYQSLRSPHAQTEDARQGITEVLKLVGPMLVATAALVWLGLYIVTGLYMAYFARVIGRYHWHWVALIAIAFPLAIYLAFELGFRVRLPKSTFYLMGLPF